MLWLRILAAVFTGTSQALISPPFSWTPLHWISWIPLLWALHGVRPKGRFWLGWLMGTSALIAIFHWLVGTVQRFSMPNLPLAIGILILFSMAWGAYGGFFGLFYPRIKRWAGPAWPFAIAALLVALEFANPQLFPFYQGVAHYQNAPLFQVASLTGVRGLSFLVLLVNCLIWAGIEGVWLKRGPVQPRHLVWLSGATAGLLIAVLIFGAYRLHRIRSLEQDAPSLRVGLVQLNLGIKDRARRNREDRYGILEEYFEESERAIEQGAQVVVWPEGGSPYRVTGAKGREIASFARAHQTEMWIGALSSKRDPETRHRRYHNSAYRFDAGGERDEQYDKIVLLPFGEFIPGRELFPKLTRKIPGVGNFYPGEDVRVFDTEWARFNFLICYEAIRSRLVRRSVRAGSRFFVTITNDAWFGATSCPSQHLMLTANRCTEYGCPMVRVATTGISAVVDPRGQLVYQTVPYTKETVVVDVPLIYAPTLYTRIGDTFSWLCVAVSAAGLLIPWWRRRQSRADPAPAPKRSRKKARR